MCGVVLMMALSGGADVPAMNEMYAEPAAKYGDHGHKEYRLLGGRRGCHGGGGCCGGGCYGGGCYGGGCTGGGYYGGCTGGWGGCTGGYGYGGWGGGYYGSMPYEGGYGYVMPYNSSMNYGGLPVQGGYQYGGPFDDNPRGYYDNNTSTAATIVVRLPANATLTVDNTATRSTGSVRTFVSPPLEAGKSYKYTLRAEETRDGKKVERTREVNVRAGQTSEVTIDFAERIPAPGQ